MKPYKTIWVTDNKKYIEQIKVLTDKLFIDDIVLDKECNLDVLQDYDLVVFLLNPLTIANKFFISGINTILEKRKSSKTILFMINDVHTLSPQEHVSIRVELLKSLNGIIENPAIHFCSTFYGSLYWAYIKKQKTIIDLQKDSNLLIPTVDGMYLSGRDIKEEHVQEIQRISRVEKLSGIISTYLEGLKEVSIDVTKKNILVIGPKSVGKSTLVEVISRLLGESISINDSDDFNNINELLYDKIIVMIDIDIDIEKELVFVEEVCSKYVNSDMIFIVNKMDNYMFYGMGRKEIVLHISNQLKQLTQSQCSFISAYYMKKLLDLKEGVITEIDVVNDNNIVFEDLLGFPLCKERNKEHFTKLLKEISGQDDLLIYLEG